MWARGAGRAVPDRAGDVLGAALAVLDAGGACALLAGRVGVAASRCCPAAAAARGRGRRPALVAIAAKWLLVGRFRAVSTRCGARFVWRNELADTFVEVLAVPWLAGRVPRHAADEPVAARARRPDRPGCVVRDATGCPRPTWSTLGDGGEREPRLCAADPPLPRPDHAHGYCGPPRGRDAGPARNRRCPARRSAPAATLGPASLVMRGETVPADTRWLGNPIEAWRP